MCADEIRPLVFSGPSGSGKSTIIKMLMEKYPTVFAFGVSHTTRSPRVGEENGREYYFVTKDEMENMIANGDFVEYTVFSNNLYGTSKRAITDVQNSGRICVLDLDKTGVLSMKKTNFNPIYIMICPPSLEKLEERLRLRGTENEESLCRRLSEANESMKLASCAGLYDHVIINDDLNHAFTKIDNILSQAISTVISSQMA